MNDWILQSKYPCPSGKKAGEVISPAKLQEALNFVPDQMESLSAAVVVSRWLSVSIFNDSQ